MSTWTDDETRELVTLWPKASAAQIARRLHRPRAAVSGKVKRLRAEGLLPDTGGAKHFEINPRTPMPRTVRPPQLIMPPPRRHRSTTGSRCNHAHCSSSMPPAVTGRSVKCTRSPGCSAVATRCRGIAIADTIDAQHPKADANGARSPTTQGIGKISQSELGDRGHHLRVAVIEGPAATATGQGACGF